MGKELPAGAKISTGRFVQMTHQGRTRVRLDCATTMRPKPASVNSIACCDWTGCAFKSLKSHASGSAAGASLSLLIGGSGGAAHELSREFRS
jgi:hypothetical protein